MLCPVYVARDGLDTGDTAAGVDAGAADPRPEPVPDDTEIMCPSIDLEDAVHAAFHAMRYAWSFFGFFMGD